METQPEPIIIKGTQSKSDARTVRPSPEYGGPDKPNNSTTQHQCWEQQHGPPNNKR